MLTYVFSGCTRWKKFQGHAEALYILDEYHLTAYSWDKISVPTCPKASIQPYWISGNDADLHSMREEHLRKLNSSWAECDAYVYCAERKAEMSLDPAYRRRLGDVKIQQNAIKPNH